MPPSAALIGQKLSMYTGSTSTNLLIHGNHFLGADLDLGGTAPSGWIIRDNQPNAINLESSAVTSFGDLIDMNALAGVGPYDEPMIQTIIGTLDGAPHTLFFSGPWSIQNNLTLSPLYNIRMGASAIFNITANSLLTINGAVDAPIRQRIFNCSTGSTVLFGNRSQVASVMWFGAVTFDSSMSPLYTAPGPPQNEYFHLAHDAFPNKLIIPAGDFFLRKQDPLYWYACDIEGHHNAVMHLGGPYPAVGEGGEAAIFVGVDRNKQIWPSNRPFGVPNPAVPWFIAEGMTISNIKFIYRVDTSFFQTGLSTAIIYTTMAIWGSFTTVKDCVFDAYAPSAYYGGYINRCISIIRGQGITIENNTIHEYTCGIHVSTEELYGAINGPSSPTGPYLSYLDGQNLAMPGAYAYGVYYMHHLTIRKNIIAKGSYGEWASLINSGIYDGFDLELQQFSQLTHNAYMYNCGIFFGIYGPQLDQISDMAGIGSYKNVTIEDNKIILNSVGYGILVNGYDHYLTINTVNDRSFSYSHFKIINNYVNGCENVGICVRGGASIEIPGVHALNYVFLVGWDISGNHVTRCGDYRLNYNLVDHQVTASLDPKFSHKFGGIFFKSELYNEILSAWASPSAPGSRLERCRAIRITNNAVEHCYHSGIRIGGPMSSVVIANNTVSKIMKRTHTADLVEQVRGIDLADSLGTGEYGCTSIDQDEPLPYSPPTLMSPVRDEIHTSWIENLSVHGNAIYDCEGVSLAISYLGSAHIHGNLIRGVLYNPLQLTNTLSEVGIGLLGDISTGNGPVIIQNNIIHGTFAKSKFGYVPSIGTLEFAYPGNLVWNSVRAPGTYGACVFSDNIPASENDPSPAGAVGFGMETFTLTADGNSLYSFVYTDIVDADPIIQVIDRTVGSPTIGQDVLVAVKRTSSAGFDVDFTTAINSPESYIIKVVGLIP